MADPDALSLTRAGNGRGMWGPPVHTTPTILGWGLAGTYGPVLLYELL